MCENVLHALMVSKIKNYRIIQIIYVHVHVI